MRRILFLSTIYFLLSTSAFAQSVDLLWQGDGYVPPFYKGRVMWSQQSKITLLAIPQDLGNPADLNYKWVQNGTVLGSLSGVGKNTLTLSDTILSKSQTIRVEIVSEENEALAQAFTTLTPVAPTLLVYENSPLYGLLSYRDLSGTYNLKEPEVTFEVIPLFFSASDRFSSDLKYIWKTNNQEVEEKSFVIYRAPENSRGSSSVSINVNHKNKILQTANKRFTVIFGND